MAKGSGRTLYDKVWESHTVDVLPTGQTQLFIGLHLIHEITTAPAFDMLREKNLQVGFPERTFATLDHVVPTDMRARPFLDSQAEDLTQALEKNTSQFGIQFYGLDSDRQGIVHVIGPQLGLTQPGMTLACGDSHTSTHGAFGTLAFGIGTSQVRDVLATQTLAMDKLKVRRINIRGALPEGVYAKDVILSIIRRLGVGGGKGFAYEYCGPVVEKMNMEERMTICNMSIEMGARGGLIAPDEITFSYIKGRRFAPQGEHFDRMVEQWRQLKTDPGAQYDHVVKFDAADIAPMITYGTNPGMGIKVTDRIPTVNELKDISEQPSFSKSLEYMGLQPGSAILGQAIDYVFIGSCTNARIEDLRLVASLVKGKHKATNVEVWVVPGSKQVENQARQEGLDKIFEAAGFQLRQPGCSACLGMNEDKIPAGKYCISTSNRNFEGRQGPKSRTFLASPLSAAAAAITGKVTDVRELV